MTATIEDAPNVDFPETPESDTPVVEATTAAKRERDFTKFRPAHQELADYVNANSGLDPITPNQVKALLALRVDFGKLPEQVERRAARKVEREQNKGRYSGLTPEQVKAAKAAERAERQAERLEARVAEAKAKAEALRTSATASGEDIAAAVETAQSESESEDSGEKRRIGRRR